MFSKLNAHKLSTTTRFRLALAMLLCMLVIAVSIVISPITRSAGSAAGTLSDSNSADKRDITPVPVAAGLNGFNYLVAPQATVIQGTYDPHTYPCATPRHHFTVGAGQARIVVQVNAQVPANDLSVSLLHGSDPSPELITTEDT